MGCGGGGRHGGMTDLPNPRRSLERLEAEQGRLCERLLELTPVQLDLPSNLPGWRVLDLAVHITRVCDSILLAVQRASVGDQTPAFGAAATTTDQGTTVQSRIIGPAEVPVIHASPGCLCLALYGRVRVDAPGFAITGPADTADRFAAIYGPTTA